MWVDYNTSISHFNGSSFRIRYKIKEVQTKYHKFNFIDPFIWFEESCNIMFGMWLLFSSPLPVISLDTNKCQNLDVCLFASQNRFQTYCTKTIHRNSHWFSLTYFSKSWLQTYYLLCQNQIRCLKVKFFMSPFSFVP